MYTNKKALVAGGTGTVGIPLVHKLARLGANLTVASLDNEEYATEVLGDAAEFIHADLTNMESCLHVTKGQDYVLNLLGMKGSTGIGTTKAASYFVPMIRYQTNLMDAAFRSGVERYLFVSSVCVYPQSEFHVEDNAWNGLPEQGDRFPGVAKRMGEFQAEAYREEYGWDAVRIVRPSNIYGPFDDFDPATAQVIPALISRVINGEDPVKVWGDGSVRRDFIFSDDAADGMLLALEIGKPCLPVNLGSGVGTTIKELVETILRWAPVSPKVQWDPTGITGDPVRILSMDRAEEVLGFRPAHSLDEGVKKTIQWYLENKELAGQKKRALDD